MKYQILSQFFKCVNMALDYLAQEVEDDDDFCKSCIITAVSNFTLGLNMSNKKGKPEFDETEETPF